MVFPSYNVKLLIHPDYIICQECESTDLKAINGTYDPETNIFNVDMAGCTFLSYKLFQCKDCELFQITPSEIFNSLKYDVFNWLRSNSDLELSEYLFDKMMEQESSTYRLLKGITDKKVLAKLRLILPEKYQQHVLEQNAKLDESNPLLEELELLAGKPIPRLTIDKINDFGYLANNHSILRLNLTGLSLKKIPERISLFPNLRFLSLQDNCLTELPNQFDRFTRLEGLNLSHNDFETFPSDILNIPTLRYLSVANNPLRRLPHQFSKLDLKLLEVDQTQYKTNQSEFDRMDIRNVKIVTDEMS